MKLKRFPLVFFFFISIVAFAQLPKVAVLDTLLPKDVEKSVSVVVTEKISEQLVESGKYIVLDRTTVGQSLKEIEFQMSGLVSDAEIKKAGEQLNTRLGAAYVVVAQVSVVSGAYFVTAKMIDVKTGEITGQASDEEEGKASVTMKIAQRVGSKLAAGTRSTSEAAQPGESITVEAKAPTVAQPQAVVKQELSSYDSLPKASITIDGNFDDWNGVPPAFSNSFSAKTGSLSIDKVYLAVDSDKFYMRFGIKDTTPSSFFHPNNFDTSHKYPSYGLDVKSARSWLVIQIFLDSNPQAANRWLAQIGRMDTNGKNWSEVSKTLNCAMKGSSSEAAFPLELMKKLLGSPNYHIVARTGYQGAQGWVSGNGTLAKFFSF